MWEAVGAFRAQHALRYHVVNPLATFRVREARQMGRDKRDLTDAEQIAQRLRTGVVTQCQLLPANYMQLRRGVGAQIKCAVERDPDETGGMKSRVHPKYKTKYRVRNWASYERA